METVAKREFRIRDLPTKSVTLFPTRAQIVREIKDVTLRVSQLMSPTDVVSYPILTAARSQGPMRSPSSG